MCLSLSRSCAIDGIDTSTTQTYNASPSATAQALLSSELAAKQAKLVRVDDYMHAVDGSKTTIMVNVLAEWLPSKARAFAGSGVKITITTVALGDSVAYTVDPHGLSAKVSAVLRLSGDATTMADLFTTLEVRTPLLGGRIEKRATRMVDRPLAKGTKLVEKVIEEQDL